MCMRYGHGYGVSVLMQANTLPCIALVDIYHHTTDKQAFVLLTHDEAVVL